MACPRAPYPLLSLCQLLASSHRARRARPSHARVGDESAGAFAFPPEADQRRRAGCWGGGRSRTARCQRCGDTTGAARLRAALLSAPAGRGMRAGRGALPGAERGPRARCPHGCSADRPRPAPSRPAHLAGNRACESTWPSRGLSAAGARPEEMPSPHAPLPVSCSLPWYDPPSPDVLPADQLSQNLSSPAWGQVLGISHLRRAAGGPGNHLRSRAWETSAPSRTALP